MSGNYFSALKNTTATRFWINNPTGAEIEAALAQGAVGCTTNPAYCSRLATEEPEYLRSLIDLAIDEEKDTEEAAIGVYKRAAKRIMDSFSGLWKESGGSAGFVTIQDDPRRDEDKERIVRESLANRSLGPNYMTKIPVIPGAMDAIDACVEADIPICATEIFALSQAERICQVYRDASRRSEKNPPIYITHISGIFDEYLGKYALRNAIQIDESVLRMAGLAIARREYELIVRMGIPTAHLMGGGARGTYHFTGLVGGQAHVTINWSTAQEIMDSGTLPESAIGMVTPSRVIDELREKFPDFRRAYDEGALPEKDFAGFGPVQLFRNMFLKGWYLLLAEVSSRKAARAS